ncbi:MAG TPA: hypothetical protein VGC46_13715 [Allosphingosinicella sp.]
MNSFDAFAYFWLGGVAFIGMLCLAKAVRDLRAGEARWRLMGDKITRADDPFYYWLSVISDLFGVVVTGFMFWFGLDMLRW